MQKDELKKINEYVMFKNSAGGCAMVFCGVFFVGMLAAMIYGLTDLDDMGVLVFAGGVGALIFGALLYISLVKPRVEAARREKAWAQSGEGEKLIEEFNRAKVLLPDIVRLGETYIFARNTGSIVKYEEVKSARVVTIKTNGAVLETDLVATLRNGRSVVLCKVPRANGVPPVIQMTAAAIKAHNPGFQME